MVKNQPILPILLPILSPIVAIASALLVGKAHNYAGDGVGGRFGGVSGCFGDYTQERSEILDSVTREEFWQDLQRIRKGNH